MLFDLRFLNEVDVAFRQRRKSRRIGYALAEAKARELGLPLLVIGDPDTGFVTKHFGRSAGCGDVCYDLTGCPGCPRGVRGPIEETLGQVPSQSHVIYVSCTLEYCDDLPLIIEDLERIAPHDGLFVVRLRPESSTFWLFPGAKWKIYECPPEGDWVYKRIG